MRDERAPLERSPAPTRAAERAQETRNQRPPAPLDEAETENKLLTRYLVKSAAEAREELKALQNPPRSQPGERQKGGGGGGQQSGSQETPAGGEDPVEAVLDPHTGLPLPLIRPGLRPILTKLESIFARAGLQYVPETEDTPEFWRSFWVSAIWLGRHQKLRLDERMAYFGGALFDGLAAWRRRREQSEESIANRLLAMLAEEGGFLGEHSLRVMTLADAVCDELKLADAELREKVRAGAMLRDLGMGAELTPFMEQQVQSLRASGDLHMAGRLADIGALRVPAEIREKPGPLSSAERAEMMRHPEYSEEILLAFPAFRHLGPVVRSHHERWDGKGYPDGLMGRRIPLASRIIAVADVFDALTSDRPWRNAASFEQALQVIQNGAGTQFDPEVARAFVLCAQRLRAQDYL